MRNSMGVCSVLKGETTGGGTRVLSAEHFSEMNREQPCQNRPLKGLSSIGWCRIWTSGRILWTI
jgi:hypothetical protein